MDTFRLLTRGTGIKLQAKTIDEDVNLTNDDARKAITSPQASKKRKRESDSDTLQILSEDEIRQLHKSHKIKITDLRSVHDSRSGVSRKSQKQASRLYSQPLQTFTALQAYNVSRALISNISSRDYVQPTDVQLASIPVLLAKDTAEPDLLTVAPTGSGKTLAFLIPALSKAISARQEHPSAAYVRCIILAPTKELVAQIVSEGRKLAANTGVRITAFRKGMRLHESPEPEESFQSSEASESDMPTQRTSRVVKAEIIVSTPLAIVHAITPDATRTLILPQITTLVLDEADVLLDTLFRDQTMAIWSACTNHALRVCLWSATIGSNIEELAVKTITTRPSLTHSQAPLLRCIIGLKDTSLPNISHRLIYASTEPGKLTGLRNLLRPAKTTSLRPPFLIFTQTIERAEALHKEIQYDIASSDTPRIASLHASLSPAARETTMQEFRRGKIWVLITTDLLSRGIDFRGVNVVINYDIPTTVASYVHRAGRTGRAQRNGSCVTLFTSDDIKYLRGIVNVIKKSGSGDEIPSWLLDTLPTIGKNEKKDLKMRGIDVRRAIKESDDKQERRRKGRNVVGTMSGYEKKLADRKKGMIEGSRRRKDKELEDSSSEDDDFHGFE